MAAEPRRVRVVQLIPAFAVGGAERMVVDLATNLDPTRFDASVISFHAPRGTHLEGLLAHHGIEFITLGKRLGFDPQQFWRIHRILRRIQPDVVHSHLATLAYALPAYIINARLTCVHTVHSLAQSEADPASRIAARLLFRARVTPVAIAKEVEMSIRRLYRVNEIPLVPNGVPVEEYQRGTGQRDSWRQREGFAREDFIVACVARLAPPKNHAMLLNAFAPFARAHPRAKLLLVGEGTLRLSLEEQVESLGLTDHVRFAGVRDDIPQVLAASDVFVLASDIEGNPLSVMEAMASGKAVVATAVGGVPELINSGDTGLLVPPGGKTELTDALNRLIIEPGLAQRLGSTAARFAAKQFSAEAMARRYEELYLNLLRKRRTHRFARRFHRTAP